MYKNISAIKLNQFNSSCNILFYIIAAVFLICIFGNLAMAGTGGSEFSAAETRITDIITGVGGKLIAALSLAFAMIGSIMKFNTVAVASAFGVGMLASAGVVAVQAGITALI